MAITVTLIAFVFMAEDEIRHLAYFDPLTHLPNRRLLMDRFSQAQIASNRSREFGALMILDLDHFKSLNDTHRRKPGRVLQHAQHRPDPVAGPTRPG